MRDRGEWLFARTVFPVSMAAAIAVTLWLLHDGVSPAVAFVPASFGAYALVALCERILPYHEGWLHSRGDLRVDVKHFLASGVAAIELLRPFALAGAVALAGWLSRRHGSGLWPNDWPLWVQLPLALVVGELFMYWVHRLTHEVPFLWRFHATHHSAPRLYWLNSVRFHPLDLAASFFCWYVPLIALGASETLIALYTLVTSVHGVFQHANLPLRLGPLNWVFSMAELHRWHHSPLLEESNSNFGQNLIVWDVVFGTRFLPRNRVPPSEVGLPDLPGFPTTWWAQVMAPLRWARIERRSASLRGVGAPTQSL